MWTPLPHGTWISSTGRTALCGRSPTAPTAPTAPSEIMSQRTPTYRRVRTHEGEVLPDDDDDYEQRDKRRGKRAGAWLTAPRAGMLFFVVLSCLIVRVLGAALPSNWLAPAVKVEGDGPLKPVLLFRKPEVPTGQLVVHEEGLAVLSAQKEPFAIVAAVGPTRTGKSSILGRAFLRGAHENLFETGSGVTSHTCPRARGSIPTDPRPGRRSACAHRACGPSSLPPCACELS